MFVQIDPRKTRAYTCALLDMVDQGMVDRDRLIQDLLGWMSVAEFARRNEYIQDEQDQDE
jgi:hypothetical protein